MRWRDRRESSNIEDRRGSGGGFGRSGGGLRIPIGGGGGRRAGFGGIGFILFIVIVSAIFGINPLTFLSGSPGGSGQVVNTPSGGGSQATDEMSKFVSVVLADTEDTWNAIFQKMGERYSEPTLVLFSGATQSACGYAQSASGPFYCPNDHKLYIDLAFYEQLRRQFKAPGDFAQAYVIAHEVGHHVQNLVGILPKFNEMRQRLSKQDANEMSIRVELQADCFAGVWARYTAQKGILDEGDVEEALNAATQIGDDAIQRRTQGYVVPESFNHGTSQQRVRWFRVGLTEGDINACDTFNASNL
ncbi:MAG: zinc metallopeptidase [Rhodobiaceae bacterium]|nr:zinc metallopeptidase [Rhodobiaceae bacterium]MCC0018549.1 zinc metallopeptidase [Rhodobiaceae bacterium]MCC0050446.1 zinc metallopeptidase [Rhodobiaceae bacterium]MCC0061185.1 zinc metallopeptidase [Rhodobiaceae bacterium]